MRRLALVLAMMLFGQRMFAVEIIAHRGASFDAPENTLAAFKLGYEQGADAIELDVHLTRDQQVVVIHDGNTERVAGANMVIAERSLESLQKLNVGAWGKWTNQAFKEKMPTLAQALKLVPPGKKIFVEIKTGPEIMPALEKVIVQSKLAAGTVVFITFNYESAVAAKMVFRNFKTHWIVSYGKDKATWKLPELGEMISKAKQANVDGVDLNFNWPLDKEAVGRIKAAGLECHVWTVDDPERARELAAAGADSITTNRPKWLREELAK